MAATLSKKAATVAGVQYTNNSLPEVSELQQVAYSQWRYIHTSLGLIISNSHKKHSPCQGCQGVDRFRIDKEYDNTGRWICGGGGNFQSGDGFGLLMHVHGWSFPESLKAVADQLGFTTMNPDERKKIKEAAKKAQEKMAREISHRTRQLNADSYLMDCTIELESAIKARQGQRALEHSSEELFRATRLYGALESNYGGLRA